MSNSELQSVPTCRYPFDMKLELVCVNPYHYERKKVSRSSNSPIPASNPCEPLRNITASVNSASIMKNNTDGFTFLPESTPVFTMMLPLQTNQALPSVSGLNFGRNTEVVTSFSHTTQPYLRPPDGPLPTPPTNELCNHQNSAIHFPVFPDIDVTNGLLSCASDPSSRSGGPHMDHWCTIVYHEFDVAVGESFKVPTTTASFTIDGYFDLSSSSKMRMSLGQYTNIHRTEASERTRMYIGKGVELELINHEVYLSCLSDCSIFVENYYLDELVKKPYGSVVHKIYPRAYVKFFDFEACYNSMGAFLSTIPPTSLGGSWRGSGPGSERGLVNSLMKYCGARLSFVKGWGPDYPRKRISNTPCWIDIVFTEAVLMMNELLEALHTNHRSPYSAPRSLNSQLI